MAEAAEAAEATEKTRQMEEKRTLEAVNGWANRSVEDEDDDEDEDDALHCQLPPADFGCGRRPRDLLRFPSPPLCPLVGQAAGVQVVG